MTTNKKTQMRDREIDRGKKTVELYLFIQQVAAKSIRFQRQAMPVD